MEKQMQQMISKELERFHCSILLEEVKEKVRKLKAYGVDESEIVTVMNEEQLFPQLIVTEEYKIGYAGCFLRIFPIALPDIMPFQESVVRLRR